MSYVCPKCKKTRKQLVKENKLNLVQGYQQCATCHSDLEDDSVVLRSDLMEEARRKAVENDDFIFFPITENSRKIAKALNVEPKENKIPNINKYLPEWYQDELRKRFEGSMKSTKWNYEDYREILD